MPLPFLLLPDFLWPPPPSCFVPGDGAGLATSCSLLPRVSADASDAAGVAGGCASLPAASGAAAVAGGAAGCIHMSRHGQGMHAGTVGRRTQSISTMAARHHEAQRDRSKVESNLAGVLCRLLLCQAPLQGAQTAAADRLPWQNSLSASIIAGSRRAALKYFTAF